jgi:hypothetical protein
MEQNIQKPPKTKNRLVVITAIIICIALIFAALIFLLDFNQLLDDDNGNGDGNGGGNGPYSPSLRLDTPYDLNGTWISNISISTENASLSNYSIELMSPYITLEKRFIDLKVGILYQNENVTYSFIDVNNDGNLTVGDYFTVNITKYKVYQGDYWIFIYRAGTEEIPTMESFPP